jgi:hypothetical protein
MKHALFKLAGLAFALSLGACSSMPSRIAALPQPASPAVVMDTVKPGISTKDEVAAILGKARDSAVFDSGYEVWVYEFKPTAAEIGSASAAFARLMGERAMRGKTEVVVLFARSGIATKVRLRPIPDEIVATAAVRE